MNACTFLFFLAVAFGPPALAQEQDNIWLGTTTAWGTASNWSLNAVPTTDHNVKIPRRANAATLSAASVARTITFLDSLTTGTASIAVGTQTLTVGTTGAPGNITVNNNGVLSVSTGTVTLSNGGSMTLNSGGSITLSGAGTINVSGDWTNDGGTFTPGTGTVVFNSTTAAQTIGGTATTQTFNSITVNKTGQTLSVGGSTTTLTLSGTLTLTAGTFAAGTATTINVAVNWSQATAATFTAGTGTVVFNGTGAQQILGTLATKVFNDLIINKSAGTLLNTAGGTTAITVGGNLTQTQGNFTPPATLNVTGGFTHTDGTLTAGTTINIGGNWTRNGGSFTSGTGTVVFNGSVGQSIGGSAGTTFNNLTMNNASGLSTDVVGTTVNGTLTLTSGLLTLTNGLTLGTGATISRGGGSLSVAPTFGSTMNVTYTAALTTGVELPVSVTVLNNLTVAAGAGNTVTLDMSPTVNGTVTLTSGTLSAGGYDITAKGNWTNNGGTGAFLGGSNTAFFSGSAAQTLGGSAATTFNNLTIATGGSTVTASTAFNVSGDLSITSGTLSIGGISPTVTGTTTISGTLAITSATGTKTFGNIVINDGGVMNFTAAEGITMNGNLQVDGTGAITGTQGTWTFQKTGGGGTLSGTAVSTTLTTATFTTSYTNSGTYVVSGTLTVTATTLTNNGTLTAATALSGTGGVTQGTGATLYIGGTSAITTLNATAAGNTVEYNGSGAQTIKAANYYDLIISGARTTNNVTLTGTVGVANTFDPTATFTSGGYVVTGSTVAYNGTGGQTITLFNYNSLTISGDRGDQSVTLPSGTIGIAGVFTPSATSVVYSINGNTIDYNGTTAQTISAFNYYNLTISGTRTTSSVTLVNGGTIRVSNDCISTATFTTGGYIVTGNTFEYNGGGAQSIAAISYNNLTLSNAGVKTFPSGTTTIAGNFVISGGATADATTNLTTINFNGAGAQAIASTTYHNLTKSAAGTATLSGNITVNSDLLVSAGTLALSTFTADRATSGGTLTVASGATLSIGGTNSLPVNYATHSIGATSTINYSGADQTIGVLNSAQNYGNLTLSGSGTKTFPGGTTTIMAALTVTGVTADATTNSSTINYAGAAQTVGAMTYYNLTLSGSGAKTLTGVGTITNDLTTSGTATATTAAAFSIGGDLTVGSGTTFTAAGFNLTVSGTTSVSGTLAHSSATGTKIYVGLVTIQPGGSWTNAGNSAITFRGGITHNGATFTSGTGVYTFSTNDQSASAATSISIGSVTVTGITLTNTTTLTVATALSGAGTLAQGTSATLTIGGTSAITTLDASASGNEVIYDATGAQTIKAADYFNLTTAGNRTTNSITLPNGGTVRVANVFAANATFTTGGYIVTGNTFEYNGSGGQDIVVISYNNLTLTNAGVKTFGSGTTTIAGNFVISGGATADATTNLTTINFNGAGAQAIASAVYHNVTKSGAGTATLSGDITLEGDLTVSAGTLALSSYTADRSSSGGVLTVASGATLSIGGTNTLPANYATHSIGATSTINYSGANQVIGVLSSGQSYGHLTLSGSGTKTFPAGVTAIAGNLTITGVAIDASTNSAMVEFNGSGAQTIGASTAYHHVRIAKSAGTATFGGTTTINGDLDVASGTLATGANTIQVVGATTVSATFNITSTTGTKTFGDVTIDPAGSWTNSINEAVTINGDLANNGTLTSGTAVHTFAGSGKTLSGTSGLTIPSITVTGAYVNATTLTVATALSGAGTLAQGTSATLTIGGTSAITTLDASASGNEVIYDATGAQTIKAADYFNLTTAGNRTTNSITLPNGGTVRVANVFAANATFTTGGYIVTGNTFEYNGSGGQDIVVISYNNLTLTNAGVKTFGSGTTTIAGNFVISGGARRPMRRQISPRLSSMDRPLSLSPRSRTTT